MAKVTFTGVDAVLDQMNDLADGVDDACTKAVKNAGQLLAEKLSAAAPERTGQLKASIRAGKVEHDSANGFHSTVMPVGSNDQGRNLAMIGNILEYGRSHQAPNPWFSTTIEANRSAVVSEIEETVRNELKQG